MENKSELIEIAHSETCRVSKPGFVTVLGENKCNCDFLERLDEFLKSYRDD
jgi:hypothetical protein